MREAATNSTEVMGTNPLASVPQETQDTTASSPHPSPLIRLPAELRNRIYEYTFYQGNIQFLTGWKVDCRPGEKPDLSLLRTCRQVYSEASPIFYSINTFEFEWTFDIPRFADLLTAHHLLAVRSISLELGSVSSLINDQGGLHALYTLPSLEEMHIRGHLCRPEWTALAVTRFRLDGRSIKIFAD